MAHPVFPKAARGIKGELAHLQTQATRRKPAERLRWKIALTRRMYERGYNRQDILELFRFIDWVLVLPAKLEQQFQVELTHIEAERNMPYITTIERQDIEKGLQQGEVLILKRQLSRRFGLLPDWVTTRLEQANQEALEHWADQFLVANRLEDVFIASRPASRTA